MSEQEREGWHFEPEEGDVEAQAWRRGDAEAPEGTGEREGVKYGEPEQADVEGHMKARRGDAEAPEGTGERGGLKSG